MRRVRSVPLLLLLTACGGGTGTPVRSGSPAPTTSVAESPGTAAPSPTVSAASKHGSATVTYRGTASAWPESACETTRGTDGEVVGWMATFQDADEQAKRHRIGVTDSAGYVQLRVRRYTGAGSYDSGQLSVRLVERPGSPAVQTGFGAAGQSLTLTDGGHRGTYRGAGLTVEFECDPSDDTSTEPGQGVAARPSAGTAYVVRPEGAVFRFTGVRCGTAGGDTEVLAGGFPHFFRLRTGTKPGAAGAGRVLFGVHGVVLPFADSGTRVELDGTPLAGGTFRYSPGGPNATTDVTRGAFACDS